MPIYEFECTCCPSRFELKRGFHDETPVSCPSCGKKAQRRFSSVPIIFKGSGFYVTDYKGGQSATSAPTSSSDDRPAAETPKKEEATSGAGDAGTAKSGSRATKKAEAGVGAAKDKE